MFVSFFWKILKNKTDEEFVTLIDKDLCEIIV